MWVDQFGDDYRNYRQRVGMLTPKIARGNAKQVGEPTPT